MRLVLRTFGQGAVDPRRAGALRRSLALFGLALLAATWRLSTPQHVFPQVPLVGFGTALPAWCDWVGAACMVAGLTMALVAPRDNRLAPAGLLIFVLGTLVMVVLDQQRLQPWAYQFMLVALVLAVADSRTAFAWLRLFIVSFYFHSALTKFDYTLLHTLGQQFLTTLVGLFGATLDAWADETLAMAAMIFPAGELAVAVGLCFARTRTIALAGAIALHGLLLVILGPWGLDHKPGVLIWNLYFIVQDVLLFAPARHAAPAEPLPGDTRRLAIVGQRLEWIVPVSMSAAIVLPFLWRTAWFDIWPSWGLYAPSAQRVTLLVHRRALGGFPAALQPFIDPSSDPNNPWLHVRPDRWALSTLGAPIYPQARFQLGAAEAIIARYAAGQQVRVVRFGLADRFTGERTTTVFTSLAQLQQACGEYWFNASPRQQTLEPPGDGP